MSKTVVAIVLMVASGSLCAQSAPGTAPSLQFEVASIRQAAFPNPDYFAGYLAGGTCGIARPQVAGDRVSISRVTLCGLIQFAFDVKEYQVVDRPAWMTKAEPAIFFDIDARAPTTSTRDQLREMVRALLADRFQLRVRREPRELPVYALVVAKGGPRLNRSDPCGSTQPPATNPPMAAGGSGPGYFASCTPTTSMERLAHALSRDADRIVVDRTGLAGGYAFVLEWAAERSPVQDSARPSLFTAIQEQLGLKLEPQRLPAEALVVERAERPSPN